MKKDHFESLKRGLEDAIAYAKGDTSRGRSYMVMKAKIDWEETPKAPKS